MSLSSLVMGSCCSSSSSSDPVPDQPPDTGVTPSEALVENMEGEIEEVTQEEAVLEERAPGVKEDESVKDEGERNEELNKEEDGNTKEVERENEVVNNKEDTIEIVPQSEPVDDDFTIDENSLPNYPLDPDRKSVV